MLSQKCAYFIRRLIDMGPRTATWLMYYRLKKRLFIAQARRHVPGHTPIHNFISFIRNEHTFDFLQSQHRPDAYHAADRVVARTFTILGHKSHTFAQDITWRQ
ncbi:MAG: hypothetical protein WC365_07940, partial [Candidatus Babeliales bacterium]